MATLGQDRGELPSTFPVSPYSPQKDVFVSLNRTHRNVLDAAEENGVYRAEQPGPGVRCGRFRYPELKPGHTAAWLVWTAPPLGAAGRWTGTLGPVPPCCTGLEIQVLLCPCVRLQGQVRQCPLPKQLGTHRLGACGGRGPSPVPLVPGLSVAAWRAGQEESPR